MILLGISLVALVAFAAPFLCKALGHRAVTPLAFGVLGACATLVWAGRGVFSGEPLTESYAWSEALGISLDLRLDGLAMLFVVLIGVITPLVTLHAGNAVGRDKRLGSFVCTLLSFAAAMLAMVLSDHSILLFVCWELTSITSFLLIGFDTHKDSARRSALQALVITAVGGLALLAGLITLGVVVGDVRGTSPDFSLNGLAGVPLADHALYPVAAILILVGCFTKSAILPFHFWLPNAMAAPTPVSALLHSATMVKAGVYLVMRLHPSLGGTELWDNTLIYAGGATMLFAAFVAVLQTGFKPLLAFSTVSSLGTLMMLIGMGASKAAAVYLLAHAMFKAALFMGAGVVAERTGAKYITDVKGLFRLMPVTAGAILIAALSMAGMFPLVGFVGKELILKAGLGYEGLGIVITSVTAVAAVLTVTAAFAVGILPALGGTAPDQRSSHDWRLTIGPVVMALGGLLAGVAPGLFAEPLIKATLATTDPAHADQKVHLFFLDYLWPATTATIISLVVLAVGAGALFALSPVRNALSGLRGVLTDGVDRAWDAGLAGLYAFAGFSSRSIQNGKLRSYLRIVLIFSATLLGVSFWRASGWQLGPELQFPLPLMDIVLLSLAVSGALAVSVVSTRLAAIAALGVVGFVIAIVFAVYGSPDLAMTQLAVETLFVVLFVLVFFRLPGFHRLTTRAARAWDALVAIAVGISIASVAWVGAGVVAEDRVSFAQTLLSLPEGYGRNVTNVILVDFRAVDTLIEVLVLSLAAVGVLALTRYTRDDRAGPDAEGEGVRQEGVSP